MFAHSVMWCVQVFYLWSSPLTLLPVICINFIFETGERSKTKHISKHKPTTETHIRCMLIGWKLRLACALFLLLSPVCVSFTGYLLVNKCYILYVFLSVFWCLFPFVCVLECSKLNQPTAPREQQNMCNVFFIAFCLRCYCEYWKYTTY